MIDHLDVTVRDPAKSRPFYEAVLGYMGYTRIRQHAHGLDFEMPDRGEDRWRCSIGLRAAQGAGETRTHDRYAPGLHHVAFDAQSRSDVDRLHQALVAMGALVLDGPAEYPEYGPGYYAVFFADPDGLKLEFVFRTASSKGQG
jgi:catechol 2,3-dioxygenase-like lactoylglutathione lyase family enzyme